MDTYVVRIYRREETSADAMVGTVERIGAGDPQAFKGLRELLQVLSDGGKGERRHQGKTKG